MKGFIILGFLIVLIASSARAETSPSHYFVQLKARNALERSQMAQVFHIDQVIEESVYAVVNAHDYKTIKERFAPKLVTSHPYSFPTTVEKGDIVDFPSKDSKYHTYEEMLAELQTLARNYADITELFSIGKSLEGRELWALKISTNKETNAFIPATAFFGAHHAREHLSTEVPLLFAKQFLEQTKTNPEIRALIAVQDLYIIPMVNPDGAMFDITGQRYKSWRKNRASNSNGSYGVDLNRNYGYGWGTGGSSRSPNSDVYMGPSPFSEPETQAVRDFVISKPNIRTILSFHTFSELVLYPWGGQKDGVGGDDQRVFEKMAGKMASMNGYTPMQASDLYIASGDTCDWAYGELGIFCFTFELSPKSMWSGGFYPGANMIDTAFRANYAPAFELVKWASDPYSALVD